MQCKVCWHTPYHCTYSRAMSSAHTTSHSLWTCKIKLLVTVPVKTQLYHPSLHIMSLLSYTSNACSVWSYGSRTTFQTPSEGIHMGAKDSWRMHVLTAREISLSDPTWSHSTWFMYVMASICNMGKKCVREQLAIRQKGSHNTIHSIAYYILYTLSCLCYKSHTTGTNRVDKIKVQVADRGYTTRANTHFLSQQLFSHFRLEELCL